MDDEKTTVRFGVLGCAHISIKLCKAILRAPNATLQAIGSRSLEKATAFAAENGLPEAVRVYGTYEGVLDDDHVDAVYIPLPTALHVTWAVRAAERGKHMLLEKPVAMNTAELDRILEACEGNGVQFMDGTMWVHHPRTAKMKEALSDEQRFGQLKWVPSSRSTGLLPSSSHAMFHLLEVLAFHHHFHVMIHLLEVLTLHHHLLFRIYSFQMQVERYLIRRLDT
ncbi:putative oxidoreductase [Arachis hypogaea]|nr:putative oxidoreductase [Arachis hypogaea]